MGLEPTQPQASLHTPASHPLEFDSHRCSLYADISEEVSSDEWAGSVLGSYDHERLELYSIHSLQQALPMEELHSAKAELLHAGLVQCPTLEQLFSQVQLSDSNSRSRKPSPPARLSPA